MVATHGHVEPHLTIGDVSAGQRNGPPRKGLAGLAALVREAMGGDPFSGAVFVFRAKRADRVKLIFWDGTGMVLVSKRLEDGKFRWPGVQDAILRLSAAELQALLEGLDWRRVHEPRQTAVPTATS
jgi:transposase